MIKQQYLLSIFILFLGFNAIAQTQQPFYKSYDWEEEPDYKITASDSDEIISYKEKIVKEFFFEEGGDLTEFDIEHKVIWLNSDQEIEDNNKIYLPYSASTELLVNKARVVTKEGKVIELDESKIMTAEDEETKQTYKYFTFEGVEKGSFIEFYYVLKRYPSYQGRRVSLQSDYPKYNVEFDLFSPSNLVFEFKSYNGLDSIKIDTNSTEKLHWNVYLDSIPALEREDQGSYSAYRQYLIYKLDRNTASYTYDISSYGKIAENVYSFLYNDAPKSDKKVLAKLIKTSGAASAKNEHDKIRAVEDYIKKTIYQVDASSKDLSDIAFIVKNNMAGERGMLILYARLFKQMGIKAQLVMTCDRSNMKFDKEFEAYNFLNNYLYYFPKIKSFLAPTDISSRLGFPSPSLTNNYGLFIKEVAMGDFNTGIGKIKFITPISSDVNYDKLIIDVTFDKEDLTSVKMNIDHSTGGYYAMGSQPFMHLLDEKTKGEVTDAAIKYINENIEIVDKKTYNDTPEDFGNKPFRVEANVTSDAFVDKAGKKYLFKMGELIGPQMEMYQEKKRVLPVENEFNRNYHREITFTIPEGFQIKNLDDININNDYKKDGEVLLKFTSSYKVEGNKVTVIADEVYKIMDIDPEIYEEYRAVINSAADFNKIKLILEPK